MTTTDAALWAAIDEVAEERWRPGYDPHDILTPDELRESDPEHPADCDICAAVRARVAAGRVTE